MLNFKAVRLLTFLGVVGLILNLLYYILQVDYFGITREIENYFVALGLCRFGLAITLAGHVGQYALPVYFEKKEKHSTKVADEVFSVISNWVIVFSVLISLILFFGASFFTQLIIPGFEQSDQKTVELLLKILVFIIPLQVINGMCTSLLNANHIYGWVELMNVVRIVLSILVLIFFYEKLGLYTLIISFWIETLLNIIVNGFLLTKVKFDYQFVFNSSRFDQLAFFKRASSAYLHSGSKQIFNFILTASVSYLPAGIFAIYKYIENIFLKISGIVLMPMSTVFFTEFASDYSKKAAQLNTRIAKAIDFGLLLSVLIMVYCISFGKDLIHFLWSDHYQASNELIAYVFLVLSIITLLFLTIETILFRVALVYNQILLIYSGLALSWLLSSVYALFAIIYFKQWGLGSVIVFNSICAALFSFVVIYKVDKKITTVFNTKYLIKLLSVFLFSLLIGYYINQMDIMDFGYSTRANLFLVLTIKSVCLAFPILFLLIVFRMIELPFKNKPTKLVS